MRAKLSGTEDGVSTLFAFLGDYFLGVLSQFNECMIDIRGPKLLSEKLKVVQSLRELIYLIGPSISIMATQTMAFLQTAFEIKQLRRDARSAGRR